ncbi:MAG: ATP-binding cassette domain-containing protein [Alphaproteobacteria bacterium]
MGRQVRLSTPAEPPAPGPTATDRAIVSTANLDKAYGRVAPVLRDVCLTIGAGERVALIGPNGSGKSTLLKCLIGLVPISRGTVETLGERFGATPTSAQRARLRRQTGFVFQHHGLVRRRSVLSNVVHGMLGTPGSWRGFCQTTAPYAWRRNALAALEAVSLADRAGHRADTLSGGQQQRVAIARAIVRQPRLLIADEPSASLDPAAGREVMDLFAALARTHGITLLFTTHDIEHALAFSDRVLALRGGRLHFDSPTMAVTDRMIAGTFNG